MLPQRAQWSKQSHASSAPYFEHYTSDNRSEGPACNSQNQAKICRFRSKEGIERSRMLSEEQIRRMLEFDRRLEVHAFLEKHGVYLNYTSGDLEDDLQKPLGSRG